MYVFNNRRSTHPYEACSQERLWSLLSHCQYLIGVESLKDESCSRSDRPIGCQAGPIFVRETTKTILREYLPESKFTSQSQHSRVFISCDQGISKEGVWRYCRKWNSIFDRRLTLGMDSRITGRIRDILQPWDLFFGQYRKPDPQRFQSNNFGQLTFHFGGRTRLSRLLHTRPAIVRERGRPTWGID